MMAKCPLCGTESVSFLTNFPMCLNCRLKVCTNCFDKASDRCKRCAPAPKTGGLICGSCKDMTTVNAASPKCLSCYRPVCPNCIRQRFADGVVCNACPLLSHQKGGVGVSAVAQSQDPSLAASSVSLSGAAAVAMVPAAPVPFGCSRCFRVVGENQVPPMCEFCHACARILCDRCLPQSLVKGQYLCALCCPSIAPELFLPKAPPPLRQQGSPVGIPPARVTPAPVAASPGTMSVQLHDGRLVQVIVEDTELRRRFGLCKGQQASFFVEDGQQQPSQGVVHGFLDGAHPMLVMYRSSDGGSPADSKYVAVDPGFVFRDDSANGSSRTSGGGQGQQTSGAPAQVSSAASSPANTGSSSFTIGTWTFRDKVFLSQGAQGRVHKCTTSNGKEVVTKEMVFHAVRDKADYQRQLDQARDIQKLSHQHLIQYLDVIGEVAGETATITVIMPYYNEKDLKEFVQNNDLVDEGRICSLMLQIAKALSFLHCQRPPLVHRDVKPENILMRARGEQALLMDLDTCRAASSQGDGGGRAMTMGRGTMEYMAPEAVSGQATTKSDVWSLGVVMFVLAALPEFPMLRLSGTDAFLNCPSWTDETLRRALLQAISRRSRKYSKQFVELIVAMLRKDPLQRPSAPEVEHELISIMEALLLHQSVPMDWSEVA